MTTPSYMTYTLKDLALAALDYMDLDTSDAAMGAGAVPRPGTFKRRSGRTSRCRTWPIMVPGHG